jgi:hypothetical protein
VTRLAGVLAVCLLTPGCANERDPAVMTFFVTSSSSGTGNLGGLAGADAHCRSLAQAAGSSKREWRAYLSAPGADAQPPIHAKDRIGRGPWRNAFGVEIAASVEDLHGAGNRLGVRNSTDEWGDIVHGSMHDVLTGSNPDGTLADGDSTCNGWTSTGGKAIVGHHNKTGGPGERPTSWNSSHSSTGCSAVDLKSTDSAGLFYCFAAD